MYVISSGRHGGGAKWQMEDEFVVRSFRRSIDPRSPVDYSRPGAGHNKTNSRLIQFYAVEGGLRTVRLDDIVGVR